MFTLDQATNDAVRLSQERSMDYVVICDPENTDLYMAIEYQFYKTTTRYGNFVRYVNWLNREIRDANHNVIGFGRAPLRYPYV